MLVLIRFFPSASKSGCGIDNGDSTFGIALNSAEKQAPTYPPIILL